MSEVKTFSATSDMSPEEIKEACIHDLREANYRITKVRKKIIDLFVDKRHYIPALDVHEYLSQDNPTMSYETTYRNLYDFAEIGLLDMIEYNQQKHFRLGCFSDTGHHHHFICRICREATAVDSCPMESVESDLSGYEIEGHKFEIYGVCPNCLDK